MTSTPVADAPINPFTATLLWLWVFPLVIGLILLLLGLAVSTTSSTSPLGWGIAFTGLGFTTLLVWLAVKAVLWARSNSAAA